MSSDNQIALTCVSAETSLSIANLFALNHLAKGLFATSLLTSFIRSSREAAAVWLAPSSEYLMVAASQRVLEQAEPRSAIATSATRNARGRFIRWIV